MYYSNFSFEKKNKDEKSKGVSLGHKQVPLQFSFAVGFNSDISSFPLVHTWCSATGRRPGFSRYLYNALRGINVGRSGKKQVSNEIVAKVTFSLDNNKISHEYNHNFGQNLYQQ